MGICGNSIFTLSLLVYVEIYLRKSLSSIVISLSFVFHSENLLELKITEKLDNCYRLAGDLDT